MVGDEGKNLAPLYGALISQWDFILFLRYLREAASIANDPISALTSAIALPGVLSTTLTNKVANKLKLMMIAAQSGQSLAPVFFRTKICT